MHAFAFSRPAGFGLALILLAALHCAPGANQDSAADRARWAKRAEQILKKAPRTANGATGDVATVNGATPNAKRGDANRVDVEPGAGRPGAKKPVVVEKKSPVPPARKSPSANLSTGKVNEAPPVRARKPRVTPESVFADAKDDRDLFRNHRRRWKAFRNPRVQKRYNTRRTRGTVQIQYSDHKRLFDHNILLAAVFAGRLENPRLGNLKPAFRDALFFDLGSAILYKQGAVTVRAIHQDKRVMPYLSRLVASDINDYRSSRTEFINIYKRKAKPLPFPVEEIDMSITRPVQVRVMLKPYLAHAKTPVILRTVNTGIDYYYSESQLRRHFQAILIALEERNVVYLFNRFVLLKPAGSVQFVIVGEIAPLFRAEKQRGKKIWRRINWKKRKLRDGFTPRRNHIRIVEPGRKKRVPATASL